MAHDENTPDPLAGFRAIPKPDELARALTGANLTLRDVEARAREAGRPVSKEVVRQMRAASESGVSASFKLRTALNLAHAIDRPLHDLFIGTWPEGIADTTPKENTK